MEAKLSSIKKLEEKITQNGFWDNSSQAQKTIRKFNHLKGEISLFRQVEKETDDISMLVELAEDDKDEKMQAEITKSISETEEQLSALELKTVMNGKFDSHNAILGIHAGAGGVESCDWAQMLLRMYNRWAQRKEYKWRILDMLHGEEAGIKNVTVLITGDYAYGYLKAESGVHRLVRISPFDSQSRRHTSFSSVDVIPEVDEEIDEKINESDLRIDTFRASGAGGQHVNVTDSAVRVTHLPTGITAQCQDERSQHKNKATALRILRSRLFEYRRKKQKEKIEKERGEKVEIAWGNQIRSYVLHPYSMIKDHRTGVEIGNVQAVMDGDIDKFIKAYLQTKGIKN